MLLIPEAFHQTRGRLQMDDPTEWGTIDPSDPEGYSSPSCPSDLRLNVGGAPGAKTGMAATHAQTEPNRRTAQ